MEEKEELYRLMTEELKELLREETDWIAGLANSAAVIFNTLTDVNWAGFYRMTKEGDLLLGPFQGRPACVRIPAGRGVCQAAVRKGETVVVEDVHQFEGHIACDSRSMSEIVVPFKKEGRVFGVLDVDSPVPGRFDQADKKGLEQAAGVIEKFWRGLV